MSDESQPTHDVFISYSSKDKKWADATCAVLEKRRIRCWIAPRDITPGTEWGAAIISGLDASKMMVLVFSSNANESAQVRREVERAISKGLIVLPFRIENINPAGAMEYALGNTHWLDGFTKPVERQFELLAKSVASLLEREPQAVSEPVVLTSSSPLRPYGRLALAGVVALLAVIGVGVFVAMFRGDRGQKQPIASAAPGPNGGASASPGSDMERLQGRWEQVAIDTNKMRMQAQSTTKKKKAAPPPEHHDTVWVFRDSTVTIRRTIDGDAKSIFRGSYSLSAAGNRSLIDFSGVSTDGEPREWRGIYEFGSGFLRVCWRNRDEQADSLKDRPRTFEPGRGEPDTSVKLWRTVRGD